MSLAEALRLLQADDNAGADRVCRNILAAEPHHAGAWHLRGIAALQAGNTAAAVTLITRAIAENGAEAAYHINLAYALTQMGRPSEAVDAARRGATLNPDSYEAHNNLGVALHAIGRPEEAAASYAEAVRLSPGYAAAHNNLGSVLQELGRFKDAENAYLAAVAATPSDAAAHANLGAALEAQGNIQGAIAAGRAAIAANPGFAPAHFNIGGALARKNDLHGAAAAYRQAIALDPGYAAAYVNLARVSFRRGLTGEAINLLEHAIALSPADAQAHSNLLYAHCFDGSATQAEVRHLAERFARLACPPEEPLPPRPRNTGRLAIGIISAEIGAHAVSKFLGAFLRHYDHDRLSITLYETRHRPEPERLEMLELADRSRDISRLAPAAARRRIIDDGIEILVDTTGHLSDSSLPLLARRCAPVQAHYIGYVGTTGVPAVDYYIGDDELTPAEFQPHFTEKIIRLPRLWMALDTPKSAPAPAAPVENHVTFGSFNILAKAGPATLDIWGQCLARVPEARLILKYQDGADGVLQARVLAGLAAHGIAPDRVTFIDWVPDWQAHMALYNRVDIALDTVPLNSGTTGFDALFMATPLVAMRGPRTPSRISADMLKALGRPEWIAETSDQYVDIVSALAADLGRLRAFKTTLRSDVLASPLCNGANLARELEEAFGIMAAEAGLRC